VRRTGHLPDPRAGILPRVRIAAQAPSGRLPGRLTSLPAAGIFAVCGK